MPGFLKPSLGYLLVVLSPPPPQSLLRLPPVKICPHHSLSGGICLLGKQQLTAKVAAASSGSPHTNVPFSCGPCKEGPGPIIDKSLKRL